MSWLRPGALKSDYLIKQTNPVNCFIRNHKDLDNRCMTEPTTLYTVHFICVDLLASTYIIISLVHML